MKKLIILDLDETLIHSESFKGEDYLEKGSYDFSFPLEGEYYCFTKKRPFLKEFIEYCFNNFKVAVWTAAGDDYAKEILSKILDVSKLEFLWTRERCTMKYDLMSMKHYGVKTLSKVHNSLGWDLKNVLIVDDVDKTAVNNYGNLIKVDAFVYQTDDAELLKLISYLEKIKDSDDYRSIEKRGWKDGI